MKSGLNNTRRITNGYSFKTNRSRINWNAKDIDKKEKPKTTNGWFLFAFLWIIWIAVFLISYFDHTSGLDRSQIIRNAFVIPSGICFGLSLFWFASRSLIFSHLTYFFYKISEITKYKKLKSMMHLDLDDEIYQNLKNYDEYEEYIKVKKVNTRIAFYISICVFSVLFLITLIVCLV